MSLQPPIPLGAQVVLHGTLADGSGSTGRGVTGRVVQRRGSAYGVALLDGRRTEVAPDELTVTAPAEPEPSGLEQAGGAALVTQRTIYAAVVGSPVDRADDAATDADADVRGVYQAPTSAFWSLAKPPKHVAGPGPSWFSWEAERFCQLGLKASPGCLELLWSPQAVWVDELGQELLDLRGAFLSRTIVAGYSAHAQTQFKKLEESGGQVGEQRWRQVAHALRLLMDGTALLRTGDVAESIAGHRDRLVSLRSGQLPWDHAEAWRLELQQKLEEAGAVSFLPALPDTERVSAWLGRLRRRDIERELG